MKVRKVLAIVLACSMLVGQTVYAEEMDGNEEVSSVEQQEEALSEEEGIKNENIPSKGEEILNEKQIDNESIVDLENQINQAEAVVEVQEGDLEVTDKEYFSYPADAPDIYIDYPRLNWVKVVDETDYYDFKIESSDESVCEVQIVKEQEDGTICYQIYGKTEGTAEILLTYSSPGLNYRNTTELHTVNVNALPADAVPISDYVLTEILIHSGADANQDGYINYYEMQNLHSVPSIYGWEYEGISVKNLTGLEYAENLFAIYLDNQTELTDISSLEKLTHLSEIKISNATKLTDISALKNLTNLGAVDFSGDTNLKNIDVLFDKQLRAANLGGTAVTMEDRLRLADIHDEEIAKGDTFSIPRVQGVFGEDFFVEESEETDCLSIEKVETYWGNLYQVVGKKVGKTQLLIRYEDVEFSITVNIDGIDANQELGAPYEQEVSTISSTEAEKSAILTSNGELWSLYPEVQKQKDNVKNYVAEKVYYGGGSNTDFKEVRGLTLDNDNVLWEGDVKLAENVQKFDAHYILDDKGILTDIYNLDTKKVERVKEWKTYSYYNYTASGSVTVVKTLLLKNDGTLWIRDEVSNEEKANEFVQIDSDVQALGKMGYLKQGQFILYNNQSAANDSVASLMDGIDGFYDENGQAYLGLAVLGFGGASYQNIGNVGIIKNTVRFYCSVGTETSPQYEWHCFILNTKNELYMSVEGEPTAVKVASNVKLFNTLGFSNWAAVLEDGTCYDMYGNIKSVTEDTWFQIGADLHQNLAGEKFCARNGVVILTNVEKTWYDSRQLYALRTDGTIWSVTGVPEQILNLAEVDYKRGDVNEDGEVDIQDLRIVLRGVCEKIELTARQKLIADVVEDGEVDIQDLRKELRYVCGKITEL